MQYQQVMSSKIGEHQMTGTEEEPNKIAKYIYIYTRDIYLVIDKFTYLAYKICESAWQTWSLRLVPQHFEEILNNYTLH